jgi:hypothetical protein
MKTTWNPNITYFTLDQKYICAQLGRLIVIVDHLPASSIIEECKYVQMHLASFLAGSKKSGTWNTSYFTDDLGPVPRCL